MLKIICACVGGDAKLGFVTFQGILGSRLDRTLCVLFGGDHVAHRLFIMVLESEMGWERLGGDVFI